MSSYVIGKREYMRCAGAIVGISNGLYQSPLWIYNYKDNRNFNEDDYKVLFSWFYEANAKSVQKQYHDEKCESDDNTYESEFNKYKKIGTNAVHSHTEKTLVSAIAKFFKSIKYQIEDEELSKKVSCYLNIIFVELVNNTLVEKIDTLCWGDFDFTGDDALPFN